MNRRPLHFITREKEWELIQRLLTIVDSSKFDPNDTCVVMASPDYSATVAMHLAHAWSRDGEMIPIVPVDVPYPDEDAEPYIKKFQWEFAADAQLYERVVLVEAGIIRGGNWKWLWKEMLTFGFKPEDITLVAMCENIHAEVKSHYVGEYYDDTKEELMFYFERFNKHWPIK